MGATLPVLAGALAGRDAQTGTSITTFYACNLAGAIAGTIAVGFFLLPTFGVRATIWLAAATNVLIGVVVFLIAVKPPSSTNFGFYAPSEEGDDANVRHHTVCRTPHHFGLCCAVISVFFA